MHVDGNFTLIEILAGLACCRACKHCNCAKLCVQVLWALTQLSCSSCIHRFDLQQTSAASSFYTALAGKKLVRFQEFAALYPEALFVFVGDNGQVCAWQWIPAELLAVRRTGAVDSGCEDLGADRAAFAPDDRHWCLLKGTLDVAAVIRPTAA